MLDDRLCGVAGDTDAVRSAGAAASAQLAEARRSGDRPRQRWLLGYMGNVARMLGESDAAVAYLRESVSLAEMLGDERGAVVALIRLGDAHRCAGEPEVGEPLLRDALARAQAAAPDLCDFALQHLGKTLYALGRASAARDCLEEALALRAGKGDAALVASTQAALRLVGGE